MCPQNYENENKNRIALLCRTPSTFHSSGFVGKTRTHRNTSDMNFYHLSKWHGCCLPCCRTSTQRNHSMPCKNVPAYDMVDMDAASLLRRSLYDLLFHSYIWLHAPHPMGRVFKFKFISANVLLFVSVRRRHIQVEFIPAVL